ncbi:DegT/DnrJ/EryC1/StrS family aminotransferase [Candidatus Poribacteria bacterium]|nr:DegT/DnrJ/EryC1/StrS family aminotransferase [Candidatus Poribacteria bacterium]
MMMAEKLALKGGKKTVPADMIHPWPEVTDEDRKAVAEVLTVADIQEQQKIQSESLAKEWADYMGMKYCIPVNSGTAALHMCVAGLGLEPGDEVIVPAFTFWASAAAVLHHNVIPVFVDIDPKTFCIDPALIEPAITERTKAVMPVHIHGMPADMDPILEIAKKHNLKVIEDVAQAHGARYKGKLCGAMGDAAGASTQRSKVLSSGSQGGLFMTDDEDIYKRAALLEYFGELVTPGREREEQEYNAYGLGWMYRDNPFSQAFVRSQLKRLDKNNALRVVNCNYLTENLSKIKGLETPYVPEECEPVYYNYVVGFNPDELDMDISPKQLREKVQEALGAEGVSTGQWQRLPVPEQEIFQARVGYGKGCPWKCTDSKVTYEKGAYPRSSEFIASHCYVFGINPPNNLELMKIYAEAFEKVMDNIDQIL